MSLDKLRKDGWSYPIGGSGWAFVVSMTFDADNNPQVDKTFDEVVEAAKVGPVMMNMIYEMEDLTNINQFTLTSIATDTGAVFLGFLCGMSGDGMVYDPAVCFVTITDENTIVMGNPIALQPPN